MVIRIRSRHIPGHAIQEPGISPTVTRYSSDEYSSEDQSLRRGESDEPGAKSIGSYEREYPNERDWK